MPFRENILSYPKRSTEDALEAAAKTATPRPPFGSQANGPAKKGPNSTPVKGGQQLQNGQQKPEDKDSPEYKKKQALIAGPILNMSYQNAAEYDMSESLFTSLKDIFEAIVINRSRSGVISPSKFMETLRKENEMFRTNMHQDAHEFLNLLLNTMVDNIDAHERRLASEKEEEQANAKEKEDAQESEADETPRADTGTVSFPSMLPLPATSKPTKWLHELFEGTLTSETRCLTCENTSQRDEPFLDLSVDLEQHSSVTSCLRRFSEEEMLCERNKFHCDNCGGLQEAEKRMKVKKLPRILALHLKRFKYTEDMQRLQKLFHKVVYPMHLRLFNTTDDAENPDRLYELYAVVVHIGGGPYHGHYIAIIKTQDRGWLLFDDEMVEPVDEGYVRNFFGDRPGLATAYVLFYQETTMEAVQKEQRMRGRRRASQDLPTDNATKVKESAELHRVQSVSPPVSPFTEDKFAGLDHAMTAPQLKPNGHVDYPRSPILTATTQLTPVQSKKERAKEEKERKAAEKIAKKEREEAERLRRKDLDTKLREAQKKQQDDLKAAMEASKISAAEDEKRRGGSPVVSKESAVPNGTATTTSATPLFKRSKSLRFSSLGRKEKPTIPSSSSVEESAEPDTSTSSTDKAKEKEKKNRFSLRKKSFSALSS